MKLTCTFVLSMSRTRSRRCPGLLSTMFQTVLCVFSSVDYKAPSQDVALTSLEAHSQKKGASHLSWRFLDVTSSDGHLGTLITL